jgi:hypothetical protein
LRGYLLKLRRKPRLHGKRANRRLCKSLGFETAASALIGVTGLAQGIGGAIAAILTREAHHRRQNKALPDKHIQLAGHVRVPERDGDHFADDAAPLLGFSRFFGQHVLEQLALSPTKNSEADDLGDYQRNNEQHMRPNYPEDVPAGGYREGATRQEGFLR